MGEVIAVVLENIVGLWKYNWFAETCIIMVVSPATIVEPWRCLFDSINMTYRTRERKRYCCLSFPDWFLGTIMLSEVLGRSDAG